MTDEEAACRDARERARSRLDQEAADRIYPPEANFSVLEFDTINAAVEKVWLQELGRQLFSPSHIGEMVPARPPLPWWRRKLNRLRLPWNLRAFGFQVRFGRERDFKE